MCKFDHMSYVRVDDLVTVEEAAAMLGVHGGTIRRYIRAGKLPVTMTIGRTQLLHRGDVVHIQRPARGRPPRTGDDAA